jgi:3alpha(or 20beta)-hydroxysteroid dehydrogenase
LFLKLDVSVATDWDAAIQETESRFGPISILVNNAGILAPAVTIVDSDPADWDQVIGTNLKGPYLGIRAVVPSLRRAVGGAIINVAFTSGHVGTPKHCSRRLRRDRQCDASAVTARPL